MGALDRLRRVTDLFNEGTELPLGMDPEDQSEVVVWVNKLNSFEVEEARRDGVAARALRVLELEKDDNPQRQNLLLTMKRWTDEQLREQRAGQMADEGYLEVLNDIESDEKWREKVAMIRRLPELLASAAADDPRREQLSELNDQYLAEVRKRSTARHDRVIRELAERPRTDVETEFITEYISRLALDEFVSERRQTEIYMALRDCQAKRNQTEAGVVWDHSGCDHRVRLLEKRADVKTLPEEVIQRVVDTLEGATVPDRDAGFSDAPASSSASSEQSSAVEETSAPSIPAEMPPAVPTT